MGEMEKCYSTGSKLHLDRRNKRLTSIEQNDDYS